MDTIATAWNAPASCAGLKPFAVKSFVVNAVPFWARGSDDRAFEEAKVSPGRSSAASATLLAELIIWRLAAATLIWLATLMAPQTARAACPDLALVLALDASGSVDEAELALQLHGYAQAFRSSGMKAALRSAGEVQVALVLWGDGEMTAQVIPFRTVRSSGQADDLAALIVRLDRRVTGNTGIGRGLWTALDLLELHASCALRRVVNVSGDGRETVTARRRDNVPLSIARSRAQRMGVMVNALAIETDQRDLAEWYSKNLIVGPGAFVMRVSSLRTFASAIELKLVREVALPALALSEQAR